MVEQAVRERNTSRRAADGRSGVSGLENSHVSGNPARRPSAAPASPRSAYVHVPFCAHRCGYCNFAVVAGREDLIPAYLEALAAELSGLEVPREVDTLYIGGGTPTQLAAPQLDQLCRLVARWHPLAAAGEWTVEANPEGFTPTCAELLARHGVTRVSLGVQSLDAAKLVKLERSHSPAQAAHSVAAARGAGLRAAVDLIFGVADETLDVWRRDVAAAVALEPDHLSTYGLTIEKGTAFWARRARGSWQELDEELLRSMYQEGIDLLEAAGFEHYEVSNFALPGRRSRHNQVYWEGASYYAAGPGAARYVDGVRETNHASLRTYLRRIAAGASPVAERESLDEEARARERLILGLRRLQGVEFAAFQAATGYGVFELAGDVLRALAAEGVVALDDRRIRLTREGLLVSDSVWPALL